ncbi:unnamed protein product, partial [marine sediment metagenome]
MTSPDVAASDLTDLVNRNSAFAFDLYQALSEEDSNLFYSPYSISLALLRPGVSDSQTLLSPTIGQG